MESSIVLGSIKVKVHAYSEENIEQVNFYIDNQLQFTDAEAPYEWRMNQRFGKWLLSKHRLKVVAKYIGGCEWSEEMDIWFFHLRKGGTL